MGKGKQTKHKEGRKDKTTVRAPLKSDNECPIWMFDNVDKAGEFAQERDDKNTIWIVVPCQCLLGIL